MKRTLHITVAGALLIAGCKEMPTPQTIFRPSTATLVRQWENDYIREADLYTTETYACISEMYSGAYYPPNSGPVCKASCAQMAKVNAMVASAPEYIVDAKQYSLAESEACGTKKKAKR
jgi:hypothetical protein